MEEILASSISRRRLYAVLLGSFAAIAGVLAALGLYAIVAHSIVTRTREIAIRIALGGRPRRVVGMIVREAACLTAFGLVLGLGGALALTQTLDSMLYGLTPLDPATYVVVSALFAFISLSAALVAARRATTGDPLKALRAE